MQYFGVAITVADGVEHSKSHTKILLQKDWEWGSGGFLNHCGPRSFQVILDG